MQGSQMGAPECLKVRLYPCVVDLPWETMVGVQTTTEFTTKPERLLSDCAHQAFLVVVDIIPDQATLEPCRQAQKCKRRLFRTSNSTDLSEILGLSVGSAFFRCFAVIQMLFVFRIAIRSSTQIGKTSK